MRFSLFDDDGTLGRDPADPRQLPPIDAGNCSCLHGTPSLDANGNCTCLDDLPPYQGPLGNYSGPRVLTEHVVQYILPWQTLHPDEGAKRSPAAGGFSLFGLSPIWLLALGVGGLYLLSTMDPEKKGR